MREKTKITTKKPETKRENSKPPPQKMQRSQSPASSVDRILFLQRRTIPGLVQLQRQK